MSKYLLARLAIALCAAVAAAHATTTGLCYRSRPIGARTQTGRPTGRLAMVAPPPNSRGHRQTTNKAAAANGHTRARTHARTGKRPTRPRRNICHLRRLCSFASTSVRRLPGRARNGQASEYLRLGTCVGVRRRRFWEPVFCARRRRRPTCTGQLRASLSARNGPAAQVSAAVGRRHERRSIFARARNSLPQNYAKGVIGELSRGARNPIDHRTLAAAAGRCLHNRRSEGPSSR